MKIEFASSSAPDAPIVVTSVMNRWGETGVQTHINEFLQYLTEQKHEEHFVGPSESIHRRIILRVLAGLIRRAIRLQKQTGRYLLSCISIFAIRSELRRTLRGRSSWCIYAQDPTCARASLSLKKGENQRVVLAVHFNLSQADEMADRGFLKHGDWFYRIMQRNEREVLAEADGVVFFSRFMEQHILQQGIKLRDRIVVPHTAAELKADHDAGSRDLIAIGSLEPRKNQSYILQVLHHAAMRGHRYTLTLVGSGEDRRRLEDQVQELGLGGQVVFTGRHPVAASLLAAHSVMVHAAKIENLPITLIESLAAGKPILAPRVGGIPEVFNDGVEGFFWPLDDPRAGAEFLIKIMEDEGLRARMSAAAKKRFRTHFARDVIHRKLLSFVRVGGSSSESVDEYGDTGIMSNLSSGTQTEQFM